MSVIISAFACGLLFGFGLIVSEMVNPAKVLAFLDIFGNWDPNVVFVDVREGEELQKTGKLKGAVHVPRGFLEFQADPTSPTHKQELGEGRKLVLYCGSGNRSVLGAKTLKEMGMTNVAHVAGGFPALQQAGAPREEVSR